MTFHRVRESVEEPGLPGGSRSWSGRAPIARGSLPGPVDKPSCFPKMGIPVATRIGIQLTVMLVVECGSIAAHNRPIDIQ